ncbi:MAG: AhpC/TSA family protein [Gammaproteobacteria bacterium]|jgi:peroxiredoxin|nr:AhpC/TSA family protein [Gammaproteobacteria bacterium]
MYSQKLTLVISFIFLTFFLQQASAELKLPAEARANATTSAESLGTLEKNMGLKAGETVPGFTTHTYEGKPVTLAELLNNGPIMVIFYRGGWCPFCNYQVRQITQAYDKFQKRNVTPVLISVDQTDGAMLVKEAYDIPFPVLSDSELAAHESFNATIELDNTDYEKYKNYGVDLEAWSGLSHHKIAAPAVFLVSPDSKVLWSHVAMDFKTRPSVDQLLNVIDNNLK